VSGGAQGGPGSGGAARPAWPRRGPRGEGVDRGRDRGRDEEGAEGKWRGGGGASGRGAGAGSAGLERGRREEPPLGSSGAGAVAVGAGGRLSQGPSLRPSAGKGPAPRPHPARGVNLAALWSAKKLVEFCGRCRASLCPEPARIFKQHGTCLP